MVAKLLVTSALVSVTLAGPVHAQMIDVPPRDAGVSVVIRCKDCGTLESIREVQDPKSIAPTATPSATASAGPSVTSSASPIGLVMYIPRRSQPAQ